MRYEVIKFDHFLTICKKLMETMMPSNRSQYDSCIFAFLFVRIRKVDPHNIEQLKSIKISIRNNQHRELDTRLCCKDPFSLFFKRKTLSKIFVHMKFSNFKMTYFLNRGKQNAYCSILCELLLYLNCPWQESMVK